jgi:uncharacterized coiled-coil protein SlyX
MLKEIQVELTEQEIGEMALEIAALDSRIQKMDEKIKSITGQLKESMKAMLKERRQRLVPYMLGKKTVELDVALQFDPATKTKVYVSTETGEEVLREPLASDEQQNFVEEETK